MVSVESGADFHLCSISACAGDIPFSDQCCWGVNLIGCQRWPLCRRNKDCSKQMDNTGLSDIPLQQNSIQIPLVFEWFLEWYFKGPRGVLWPTVFEWYRNILNSILDSLYRSVVLNGILNHR